MAVVTVVKRKRIAHPQVKLWPLVLSSPLADHQPMAGGAEDDIKRSWPTRRRDSWEGGYACDEDRGRNEYMYVTQLPNWKRTNGGECHDEQPITEDNTFHR